MGVVFQEFTKYFKDCGCSSLKTIIPDAQGDDSEHSGRVFV
jgi:hypothetical protein